MPDIFAILQKDHTEVKDLLAQVDHAAPGSQKLKDLVERIVIEESKHEAVEEAYFWPMVRDKVQGGEQLTEKALAQESEAKKVLAQLEGLAATEPKFIELVTTFAKAGREHIAYEEEQIWPKLRSVLTRREQDELGEKVAHAKKSAPTRPHPNTPSSPEVQKVAGPVAAATDKVRDKVRGRP